MPKARATPVDPPIYPPATPTTTALVLEPSGSRYGAEDDQEAGMSVSDKFRTVLAELLKARHPLLLVETHEDDRAVDEIAAVATDPELRTQRTVYDWSATHGRAGPTAIRRRGPPRPHSKRYSSLRSRLSPFSGIYTTRWEEAAGQQIRMWFGYFVT
jgi:hypothetical protein